jgi:YidC/Oxa1 family membrane protein insertase
LETWRIFLAVTLMLGVIVLTNVLFPAPPPAPTTAPADSSAVVTPPVLDPVAPPLPQDSAGRDQGAAREGDPQETPAAGRGDAGPAAPIGPGPATPAGRVIVVESPLYRYRIDTRGGGLLGAELREYESFTDSGAVELAVDTLGPLLDYGLRAAGREAPLAALAFTSDAPDTVRLSSGETGRDVALRATLADGGEAELTYTFGADTYAIGVRGRLALGALAEQTSLLIGLGPTLAVNEEDAGEDRRNLGYVTNGVRSGIRSVPLRRVDEPTVEEGPLLWAALKNKYFVVGVFGPQDGQRNLGGLIVQPLPDDDAARLAATLPLARDGSFAFGVYAGPQEPDRLAAMGSQFGDVNPLGWAFLRPIIRPLAHLFTWALVRLHEVTGLAYGWVVILFGILINVLIWPLSMKAMRAQLRNMEVQPRMKEIQEKYKGQPERLQQEMMRLYKEEGFNPFGGCLPMLIPMPVLFTLFFVFQATIEFRGTEFLWLPDLSRPDPYYIIPVLMALSMFVLQYLSYRSTPEPNPQLKMMMWFMPIFMLVVLLNFASGLNLYYASSNVARLPQQLYIMKERNKVHLRQAAKGKDEKR